MNKNVYFALAWAKVLSHLHLRVTTGSALHYSLQSGVLATPKKRFGFAIRFAAQRGGAKQSSTVTVATPVGSANKCSP